MVSSTSTVSVLLLVPLIAAALWTTFGQLAAADALRLLLEPEACPLPPTYRSESQLRYTTIHSIDQFGCVGVEMTKNALFRHVQPFTVHLLSSLSPLFLVLNIEGLRADGPSRWFPFVTTILSMCSNAGVGMPIGWLFVFLSSYRHAKQPLTRDQAEALFISHILGYIFPLVLMILTVDEYSILFWMQHPFLTALITKLWLSIRPHTSTLGFFTTQSALFTSFFSTSIIHLSMILRYATKTSFEEFLTWLPSWSITDPKTLTPENVVLLFLQWDAVWSYAVGIIAGFLYADSWEEYLMYSMGTPMVFLCLGPGAVVAAMWMWREWKLKMLQDAEVAALKAQDKKEE